MIELKLPLDLERLPEFWQLTAALRGAAQESKAGGGAAQPADVEGMALQLWVKLWITLGYLARSTNRPGWLNSIGERQMNEAFSQFGEECPPVMVLLHGGLLRKENDGYYCDLFTATNRHLAGDYITKEERGNRRSLPERSKRDIAHEANHQGQLLAPEIFRKRDGATMNAREADRSMVLIITLDRCLRSRTKRHQGTYTAGLMADACAVVESMSQEELAEFYKWLAEKYDHPMTPKTAEEILKDWERVYQMSNEK